MTVEYNINLPIDAVLVQASDGGHVFDYAFGASLKAVATVAEEVGYTVVYVVQGLDAVLVRSDLLRDVAVHPLEGWAACCTNWTTHVPPAPERVAALLDCNVFRSTGDVVSGCAEVLAGKLVSVHSDVARHSRDHACSCRSSATLQSLQAKSGWYDAQRV